MEVEINGLEVFRSHTEVIKVDSSYCFGILDGKNFAVARSTLGNNVVYIRWCKGRMPYSGNKNIVGKKAEKLLTMILDRIPNTPENQDLIEEMQCMVEKNKRAASYFATKEDVKDISQKTFIEQRKKKEAEFKDFMDRKTIYAEKNAAKKAEKEARRRALKEKKEAERQQRQQESEKRIQLERRKKQLKDELALYEKILSSQEDKEPIISISENGTTLFLGKLNDIFYKIKINEKEGTFYQITNNGEEKMSLDLFVKVFSLIDEKLNQTGNFDSVLENMAPYFQNFSKKEEKTTPNINDLATRVAISKNILIKKGLLTEQNIHTN